MSIAGLAQSVERRTLTYFDTLQLDLFLPTAPAGLKPLLIYVHGGGFSGGSRDEPLHRAFCEHYARKGWITATISYNLTMKDRSFGCDQAVQNKIETFRQGGENVNQATAFLLAHQRDFNIDSQRIVLAGSSAGAESVLQAAYWKDTQKALLPKQFRYAGVISMAGALLDVNWISEASVIPMAMFHGTCDPLVPYGTAPHHYCTPDQTGYLMLAGAHSIMERLVALEKPYFLVSDCGGGHEWASKPMEENYLHFIDDFLENDVLKGQLRQSHIIIKEGEMTCDEWEFCR